MPEVEITLSEKEAAEILDSLTFIESKSRQMSLATSQMDSRLLQISHHAQRISEKLKDKGVVV